VVRFVLFYVLPVAVLISLPFIDAGLPRMRLVLGWLGTLIGVVGTAVVAGFYFFLAIGWDANGSRGIIFAVAVGLAIALGGVAGAVAIGRAQHRASLRQSPELRRRMPPR
jgi:predicted phage tail protein